MICYDDLNMRREDAERYVRDMTNHYDKILKIPGKPTVRFTRRLNTTSAEVYPRDNEYIYNRDYVELNRNNKKVLRLLAAHEVSHVACGGYGDNHPKFKRVYKRVTGRSDPQEMPGERMEPPRFYYKCPECDRVWFLMRRPTKPGYCPYDDHRLSLRTMERDRYMSRNWERVVKNGNKMI